MRNDSYHAAMDSLPLRSRPASPANGIGKLLREWRAVRHLSQLDLALEAGVSARHLSCVETGKAQPSRDMIDKLADALDLPLRERNALLVAAGFAPKYRESSLASTQLAPIRRAIDFMLEQQEPYPAFVLNRYWDVLATNRATTRAFQRLRGGPPLHANVLRQIFDPADMRPLIVNWDEVAGNVIGHLHAQVAASPADAKAQALLEEILTYPDIPASWHARGPDAAPLPILTAAFRAGATELHFFSTFTTFGTPWDITLDELRIESMFPADEATAAWCRSPPE